MHRSPAFFCRIALLAIVPWLLAVSPEAQDTPSPGDVFIDQVEVQLVEVEVVVTDRQGNRVRGLDRDDFRLSVDGQSVPVQLFEEVFLPAPGEAPVPAAVAEDGGEAAGPVTEGRSILVFVDDSWTDRRGRTRALKNLQKDLTALGARDEVAVVRYEGGLLDVLTPWTSDITAIEDALKTVQKTTPGELARRSMEAGHADPRVREKVVRGQIQKVANAAAVTMAGLAGAQGRKLFVPVSSGWPYERFSVLDDSPTPLSEGGENFDNDRATDTEVEILAAEQPINSAISNASYVTQLADRGDSSLDRTIHPVFAAANRLGYTIYPIHVGIQCQGDSIACTEDYETSRGALRIVAKETGGGILAEGAGNATPLSRALEDTRAYYVLAFDAGDLLPGTAREIGVTMARQGLQARHRRSILTLTTAERNDLVADRALLLGVGNGDLVYRAGEEMRSRRMVRIPLELTIPMDWATTLPVAGGGVAAQLELRVASLDERGDRSETVVIPLDIGGPEPPPPGSHATYELEVEIRPKTQRVVLVLHDKITGESLSNSYERGG